MANILSQNSWWVLNKSITTLLGLDASFLLSDLITRFEYWKKRGLLDEEGFFFVTKEEIEIDTTLSAYRQTTALRILESYKFVSSKRKGIPSKLFYRVSLDKINLTIINSHLEK